MKRITVCIDVGLNDVAVSKLESLVIEQLSDLLDGEVYKPYVINIDSCIDEVKEDIRIGPPEGLDKIRQASKELAELMQEYVHERSNGELELYDSKVAELFNDFLLFVNGGIDPPKLVDGG